MDDTRLQTVTVPSAPPDHEPDQDVVFESLDEGTLCPDVPVIDPDPGSEDSGGWHFAADESEVPAETFAGDEIAGFPPPELPVVAESEPADLPPLDTEPVSTRGSIAGSMASVVLHLALLATLASMIVPEPRRLVEPPLETRFFSKEIPEVDVTQEVEYELTNPNDRELEVRKVVNAASIGRSLTDKPRNESEPILRHDLLPDELRPPVYDIPEGIRLDERIVVKGSTGEAIVQLESALDRITWEIAKSLQERKVLVVWLLDASGSLIPQRQRIAKRLNRVYGELNALEAIGQIPRRERPLLSGVVTYGLQTNFVTREPTDDFAEILAGVENAVPDPSGRENVFAAVSQVMDLWSKYRVDQGRQIMIVTVTDESGDDFGTHLELAIARCRKYGAKAYVVGPPAVFGRREGYVPYVAPEDGKTYQLPVDLGPETPMMENVELPFWFNGPQYDYLSSGFAPYALARLVSETGGVYFTTNMTTTEGLTPLGVFDTAALKPFEPDYRFGTPQQYEADLRAHPLRSAVVTAALLSRDNRPNGTPQTDLRVTPGNFRQVADNAQRSVAVSQLMIETILQAFPPGIENELERETSARWRMAFCLSYGRLLAMKVRCYEYNMACANLKGGLTPEDITTKSNHWIFKPSRELNHAPQLKRTAETAVALLERVVIEAPGTPWAILASRELQHPLGIEVEQRFIPPVETRPAANNTPQPRRPQFAPEPRRPQPPATLAPPPKPPVLPKL